MEPHDDECKRCDGDGWLEIMDPDHYGAVIGMRECPDCEGTGNRPLTDDELVPDEDES